MALDIARLANRDQLRKMGIILGIALVALVGLYYLLLAPLRRDRKALSESIDQVQREYDVNKTLVRQAEAVATEHEQVRADFYAIMESQLAPGENPIAWLSAVVQSIAANQGVIIRNLSEAGTYREPQSGRDAPPPLFEAFQAKIEIQGTYHQLGRFLAKLEERLPYGQIQEMSFTPSGLVPGRVEMNVKYAVARFTEEGFAPGSRPAPESSLETSDAMETELGNDEP